jgi:hypothetical protein
MRTRLSVVCALALAVMTGRGEFENEPPTKSDLVVTYGARGVEKLVYKGETLEDLDRFPEDAFHIWHMKSTDANGHILTSGEFGWGETNIGRSWDVANKTWTYTFHWGSIKVQYRQSGDSLTMMVTETNRLNSGIVFDGATIYPMALHLPQIPTGFGKGNEARIVENRTAPGVMVADYRFGQITSVAGDVLKPLYSGFQATNHEAAYTPIISGTTPDALAPFERHFDRPLEPGQVDTFAVSLRFSPSGVAASRVAGDAFRSWATRWPPRLAWIDRRMIGTVYLASSPQGDRNRPGGYANNPRRYFNEGNSEGFDISTRAGVAKFQARMLEQAVRIVANLKRMNAQGVITWDIEGEQYPQDTSYLCAPDMIAQVAPEMDSVIEDKASRYAGMKLDDAYFKTIRDAGFRVGVCVRPQHLVLSDDGSARQRTLPDEEVAAELVRKMRYAHDRWGATIFYVDSSVEQNGATLDASIFEQAGAKLPDTLVIPEESTLRMYAYTAPFKTFLFHGDLGTEASVDDVYPNAFSVNLVNDVDAGKLAADRVQLTGAVKRGDVLMVHADYWHPNNETAMEIYRVAGR